MLFILKIAENLLLLFTRFIQLCEFQVEESCQIERLVNTQSLCCFRMEYSYIYTTCNQLPRSTRMSEKLNTVFEKLREFLKHNDCTRLCVPVGITISSSGDHYYVRYSMSSPTGHKTLDTAIEEIENFFGN